MRLARFLPWLGLALVAAPFYRILLYVDRTLLFRDLARDFLPLKSIWAESVRAGHGIPLWNHFALGGTPLYATNVEGPLHPLNLIFLLFPASEGARALGFYLFAHYALFYAAALFLLARARIPGEIRWLLAAGLTLSGYQMSVHNLPHMLAATLAVPIWLGLLLGIREKSSRSATYLLGLPLAWPVYGGDPQFSYVMAALTAVFFLARPGPWLTRLSSCALTGFSAFFAAAAQLLPTLNLVRQSDRLQITPAETLYFSFHPGRLLETAFPLFFGNRFGPNDYWGERLVNFAYPSPFIFSTYLSLLFLFGLLLYPTAPKRNYKYLLAAAAGIIFTFGSFLPFPLYLWAGQVLPFFSFFRYPERLVFWPLFLLSLLAIRALTLLYRQALPLKSLWLPGVFAAAAALLGFFLRAFSFPLTALVAVYSTALGLGLLTLLAYFYLKKQSMRRWILGTAALLVALDLSGQSQRLVWDQSKYLVDPRRYDLVKAVTEDLAIRKHEIKRGGALRFSSGDLAAFSFAAGFMDHSTQTTFGTFQNLLPNTPGLFGIEDIAGYFSLNQGRQARFLEAAVRTDSAGGRDLRFLYDLMGVYYLPRRDPDQRLQLATNPTAQPYLFAPEKLLRAPDFDSALRAIRSPDFRAHRDAIIIGTGEWPLAQESERGNFELLERNGKEIRFRYFPTLPKAGKFLVVNENYDEHWHAEVNGKTRPVHAVNGWAMGIWIPGDSEEGASVVSLRYENPWIWLGACLTLVWPALYFALGRRSKRTW